MHAANKRWRRVVHAGVRAAVTLGVPNRWFNFRYVQRETVPEYIARTAASGSSARLEVIHPTDVARHPLPVNIGSRDELPRDAGWWGYSFHDVPERTSGETFIADLPDCRVISYRDAAQQDDFFPAILTDDRHALDLREIRFRPRHGIALRQAGAPTRVDRATWVFERVYHNHSHWMTVHLPKLLLLRERGELEDVLMPAERTSAMNDSLRLLGIDPGAYRTFRTGERIEARQLRVLGTDRFRPELLRLVPAAFGVGDGAAPRRRVYISRARASRRRLLNEDELWGLLQPAGFEKVLMEELSFEAQVHLMKETAVLVAPHGAGLTNMMFCPSGATVVEIADLAFPNPNFYAVASAMNHRYFLVESESVGSGHPLDKDMRVAADRIRALLPQWVDA